MEGRGQGVSAPGLQSKPVRPALDPSVVPHILPPLLAGHLAQPEANVPLGESSASSGGTALPGCLAVGPGNPPLSVRPDVGTMVHRKTQQSRKPGWGFLGSGPYLPGLLLHREGEELGSSWPPLLYAAVGSWASETPLNRAPSTENIMGVLVPICNFRITWHLIFS